jgi:response regulator RpfG family c-di-GMP phosphodiesterase
MEQKKLIDEVETLRENFDNTTNQIIKDLRRQEKIMLRSDQRQQKEYDELQIQLEEIKRLNKEIEDTQREVLLTVGGIGETRSKETFNHVRRVAEYSKLLGLKIGMDSVEANLLKDASPMHDIGKVGIPDSILNKPGKLTPAEFDIMKHHALFGYEMFNKSERPLLKAAAIIAHEHHEKYDGTGYPRGLVGEEIHIYGRITSIADVFDALGSKRCYKEAWSDPEVFTLLKEQSGSHFDPRLVEIFFDCNGEFLEIREKFKDVETSKD